MSNSWGETRVFHHGDMRLRAQGYKIVSRPEGGPAVWADNLGNLWKDDELHTALDEEERNMENLRKERT